MSCANPVLFYYTCPDPVCVVRICHVWQRPAITGKKRMFCTTSYLRRHKDSKNGGQPLPGFGTSPRPLPKPWAWGWPMPLRRQCRAESLAARNRWLAPPPTDPGTVQAASAVSGRYWMDGFQCYTRLGCPITNTSSCSTYLSSNPYSINCDGVVR